MTRKVEKQWREIASKRVYADEKSKQLAMLAELGSLLGGFQMMMIYELELPPVLEHRYSDVRTLPSLAGPWRWR